MTPDELRLVPSGTVLNHRFEGAIVFSHLEGNKAWSRYPRWDNQLMYTTRHENLSLPLDTVPVNPTSLRDDVLAVFSA